MKSRAFSIIELTIYLAIFSFFSFLIFDFFSYTQKKVVLFSKQNEKIIRDSLSIDLLKRDLMCASMHKEDWFCCRDSIIFKKTFLNRKEKECSVDIGWSFGKEVLRIEGEYDFFANTWKRKIVSKVSLSHLNANLDLKFSKCGRFVVGVKIDCAEQQNYQQDHFVRLRNRLF